jgi:hypothetical protein
MQRPLKPELIEQSLEHFHSFDGTLPVVSDDKEIIYKHVYMNSQTGYTRPENLGHLLCEITEYKRRKLVPERQTLTP